MVVLRVIRKSNRETVETLEWMLQEARKGRINDIVSSFRDESGAEHAAFTGLYKADSSKALMAIMRMSTVVMRGET